MNYNDDEYYFQIRFFLNFIIFLEFVELQKMASQKKNVDQKNI